MKNTPKITTGLALIAFLAGCVVTSVYPYYTPKDLLFDPALVGGAVVRAGDFVVDGSLRGRIERLGNIMAGA